MKKTLILTSIMLGTGLTVFGTPIQPNAQDYGSFPDATWGGSGIPNDVVASIRQFTYPGVNGADTITLALAATGRYFNPPTTSNGHGTYYAGAGSNFGNPANPGGPGPSAYQGSTWQFDFFISQAGTSGAGDYVYKLTYNLNGGTDYSFNPLADADAVAHMPAGAVVGGQDSQNLMFATFGGAPNGMSLSFDPNANGIYGFLLQAFVPNNLNQPIGSVAINVAVTGGTNVPDGGTTVMLLGAGLSCLGLIRRKLVA